MTETSPPLCTTASLPHRLETVKTLSTLQGIVERVTYHNRENGYSVLQIKVSGEPKTSTCVGYSHALAPGESIHASGTWVTHREFGSQFQIQSIQITPPTTLEGIEKYLGSGMIKGIGPHLAHLLVQTFQDTVFDVLENTPERLQEIHGMGLFRIQSIQEAWKEQKIIREILIFLQAHGISPTQSIRIYKIYGQNAIAQVQANPYQLAHAIQGIGFKSADGIAMHLGILKTSTLRVRAGIHSVLSERLSYGSCACPEAELIQEACQLLAIETSWVQEAIEREVAEHCLFRELIDETPCLYPALLLSYEKEVTHHLYRLLKGSPPWSKTQAEHAFPAIIHQLDLQLAPQQTVAIQQALVSKILILTGGPGTGKTTLTKAILTILRLQKIEIALCSPTGRAAKRLSECTGMEAKTIHRLLKLDRSTETFIHHESNPLVLDLLLIDEASMIDVALMTHLLKAVPVHAAILIIGDVDQLPSVSPGTVLKSMIDSEIMPTVRLSQVFRQVAHSQIIQSAHAINHGFLPECIHLSNHSIQTPLASENLPLSDFYWIPFQEPESALATILDLVKNKIPHEFNLHPLKDIQVLSPMHRGLLGSRHLNTELQKILNPHPPLFMERGGTTFAPGDKVMATVNDYDHEIFNGDIGLIQMIDLMANEVSIQFDGRSILFHFDEMDAFTLAYATTIHKSQGSEYPAVIIPIAMQHYPMLKRNLIYTGITRGKRLVILVAEKKALSIAVKSIHQKSGKRWSNLTQRLQKNV